jgi:hypothetical protein
MYELVGFRPAAEDDEDADEETRMTRMTRIKGRGYRTPVTQKPYVSPTPYVK